MRVVIIGPNGKMGRVITKAAAENNELKIVGGVGPEGREYIGKDIGQVAALGYEIGAQVTDNLEAVIEACDVIIDFSTRELSMDVLKQAVNFKKGLVCGTTGFTAEEKSCFLKASKKIPVLYAANTSKVVNIMNKLLALTAEILGGESDIEIIEMHDRWKMDAPSGTSKEMGEIIAKAMGREFTDLAVYGREGRGTRKEGSIGYHSVRSGNIPSSHTVIFGLLGERLEITHHSYDFECFARGACDGALYLKGRENGFYTIKDVLGID